MTRLRWGILGTGNIARQFATGVAASERGVLAAVASRSPEAAKDFAAGYHVGRAHASYEALLADPDVDAVYVSFPNTMHHAWTVAALRAGKHVLCEKPFAVTVAEAEEMFDVAARAGRVVVEAFMYRSHPLTHAVMDTLRSGTIGQLQLIRASFCYRTTKVAGNIRFDPALAGGALMDVGCYCVNFARHFAGAEPTAVSGVRTLHPSGVDQVAAGTLVFPGGVLATFTCGMSVQTNNASYLCGSEGYIEIPIPWKPPVTGAEFHVVRATPPRQDQPNLIAAASVANAGPRTTHRVDANKELYALEADDFAATVIDGRPPVITREDTLGNMRVLERVREGFGR